MMLFVCPPPSEPWGSTLHGSLIQPWEGEAPVELVVSECETRLGM
jgi:hypothetical protein